MKPAGMRSREGQGVEELQPERSGDLNFEGVSGNRRRQWMLLDCLATSYAG